MNVLTVENPDRAAAEAANLIAAAGERAVTARGEFNLAVSGGRTPWKMLEQLAGSGLDWSRTSLFQVDERLAPSGSPERNLTHMILTLPLECQASLRPMPVGNRDVEQGAVEYGNSLPERLDLVHLGLGPDGHTASLIPGDPVLEVTGQPVALTTGEYQGTRRMTLTYPAINQARELLYLVTRVEKREALRRLLDGDRTIPAGRVNSPEITVITDIADATEAG